MKKNRFIEEVFTTNNFKETQNLGRDFAKVLKKGNIVCLYGDLGFGKTTFVQGLAEGLGIKNRIISPTFAIIKTYKLEIMDFYHIDLYRIKSEKDIKDLGFEEIVSNSQNVTVIEWAEKLKKDLPKKRIDIEFFYEKENVRKIIFRSLNQ